MKIGRFGALVAAFLALVSCQALASGASGASGASSGAKVDRIVMASPFAPLVMPMAYILESGLLEDVADDVALKIWNTPDQLRAMMTTGSVDFASVPSNVAAIFFNKGVALKMVDISIWGVMYIVSSDTSVARLADIKGKTIFVPFRGDQPDLVFQTIARNQGFDPLKDFDVHYVNSPLDITMGLLSGNIKTALLIEPVSSMVIMKGKSKGLDFKRVINIQEELGKIDGWRRRFPNAGVVALPAMVNRPKTVDAFAKAYETAVQWTVAHPADAAKLAAKYIKGVNAKAFETSLRYTTFEAIPSAAVRPEIEKMFGAFIALSPKSVGGKLPGEGFYYP